MDAIKAFIQANMQPDAFAKLEQLLAELGGGDPNEDPEPTSGEEQFNRSGEGDRGATRDSPPPFEGMPQPGGSKFGQDARGGSYFDNFGDNARVNILDYGNGR
jgi:hypothetical protein